MLELHGDKVFDVIADRIGTLARAGDEAGVNRWREIAERVSQLRSGPLQ